MKIILTLFLTLSIRAADFNYFVSKVQNICKLENTLIIKKTFISLMKDSTNCNNTFGQSLLSQCENIKCETILSSYFESLSHGSGNIIGETNESN